jgi:PmbA protein
VSVRKGELENVERNRDKSLGVTVYLGQRRGNASTSDFSPRPPSSRRCRRPTTLPASPPKTRLPACPTRPTLPRPEQPDLDLFHPWAITSEQAAELALACEAAALHATDKRITNSEGAGVSAQQSHFFSAHTHGFRGGYASSRHSMSVAPIAGKGDDMQRDAWYSSMRDAATWPAPRRSAATPPSAR